MLKGSLAAAFSLADVFYFLRAIKKYKELLKLYEHFKLCKPLNVFEALQVLKNVQDIPSRMPIIIRGLIRAKATSVDKNILSAISATSINKTDRLKQYIFERIPYREVLANAFWVRPDSQKSIAFDLHDLNSPASIPVLCGNKTDLSGILSQIKVFQVSNENIRHPLISRLKNILNHIMFLSPFKFTQKMGQKITYHSILNDQFGYVIGQVKKTAEGEVSIENPQFISKQIAFVVYKMKKKLKTQRYLLFVCLILHLLLLYYLCKWVYRRSGWRLTFMGEKAEKLEQNIPFNQTCIVCYSAARSVIFKPCKHFGVCMGCYRRIGEQKSCPLCKQRIEGIIQIIKKP